MARECGSRTEYDYFLSGVSPPCDSESGVFDGVGEASDDDGGCGNSVSGSDDGVSADESRSGGMSL